MKIASNAQIVKGLLERETGSNPRRQAWEAGIRGMSCDAGILTSCHVQLISARTGVHVTNATSMDFEGAGTPALYECTGAGRCKTFAPGRACGAGAADLVRQEPGRRGSPCGLWASAVAKKSAPPDPTAAA